MKPAGDEVAAAARGVRESAYAPHSGFRVGCALQAEDGRVFTGCNVENASYSVTCCAERVALFNAIAAGAQKFRRMVVSAGGRTPYPCGACRQALSEFAETLPVTVVGEDDVPIDFTVDGLLPHPFRLPGRPA